MAQELKDELKEENDKSYQYIRKYTPVDKLNANFLSLKSENFNGIYVILLTTGSFNPIHEGHIDMMINAKNELEKQFTNIKVIQGYLSPTHDNYLKNIKFKSKPNDYISSKYRFKMIKLLCNKSKWLSLDKWECKQNNWQSFTNVSKHLLNQFKRHSKYSKLFQLNRLQLYYVCGLDVADKCQLWNGKMFLQYGIRLLIVRRPGILGVPLKSNELFGIICVNISDVEYDRSSTIIRELIRQKNWIELKKHINNDMIDFIKNNHKLRKKLGESKLDKLNSGGKKRYLVSSNVKITQF
eukprot:338317_1